MMVARPGSAKPLSRSPLFGVHVADLSSADVARISAIRADMVRLPVTWHLMEAEGPGVTPPWFWDGLDAQVLGLRNVGVKAIIELSNTPCWATSGPQPCEEGGANSFVAYPPKPTAYGDYGRALARIARRYAARAPGTVIAYEIWNEPNLQVFWPGVGPRPAAINDADNLFVDLAAAKQYANLVKATYPLVKAADPSAAVLAGSVAAGDVDYVNELYRSGLKGSFDALSLHPYAGVQPGDYTKGLKPDECPYALGPFWCFAAGTEAVHRVMLNNGDPSKIWFTEFGYSSTIEGSHQIGGTTGQAEMVKLTFNQIRKWNFVPVALWYALDDVAGAGPLESSFGLYATNGTQKPAGAAFAAQQSAQQPARERKSRKAHLVATPLPNWQPTWH
jgi:Cellulase (glycosyl hydrolase family 5)